MNNLFSEVRTVHSELRLSTKHPKLSGAIPLRAQI